MAAIRVNPTPLTATGLDMPMHLSVSPLTLYPTINMKCYIKADMPIAAVVRKFHPEGVYAKSTDGEWVELPLVWDEQGEYHAVMSHPTTPKETVESWCLQRRLILPLTWFEIE
jgi:hypothetical protein